MLGAVVALGRQLALTTDLKHKLAHSSKVLKPYTGIYTTIWLAQDWRVLNLRHHDLS
jgi:hypothetical protein